VDLMKSSVEWNLSNMHTHCLFVDDGSGVGGAGEEFTRWSGEEESCAE
jgi:hypothetical protein